MKEERLYEDVRYEIKDLKTAFCIGVYFSKDKLELCHEHLDELESLANTYGFEVLEKISCSLKKFDAGTYLGSGKIEEIKEKADEIGADVIIFDDEITPNQQKNLERLLKRPIIDRTELILEVFASRAQTKEASLQIELARSRYQLPRLKRLWTHLSRETGGGKGPLRGAGEKQIEMDRRMIRSRIASLRKELEEVAAHRDIQRNKRVRSGIPTFAIVGYTNAGKSTLLKALTNADVLVEDKLFATLDTTTRKFMLPNQQQILLVDTVGFIRKIPHTLVAAFKSTLEETTYTDILLHLVDVSHPMAEEQVEATHAVLKELKADKIPMITVLNKIDQCDDIRIPHKFRISYPKTVSISALERTGFDDLLDLMTEEIKKLRKVVKLRIPQSHYALVSELMQEGKIIEQEYEENDILLHCEIPIRFEKKVMQFEVS